MNGTGVFFVPAWRWILWVKSRQTKPYIIAPFTIVIGQIISSIFWASTIFSDSLPELTGYTTNISIKWIYNVPIPTKQLFRIEGKATCQARQNWLWFKTRQKNGFLSTKNLGSSLSQKVTNFPDPTFITPWLFLASTTCSRNPRNI